MSARFEELDRQPTAIGEIVLRRRLEPTLNIDVYEVKLGDEYLMSSLFTASETKLAELALAALAGTDLDIVVGGLGLGYTAHAVLNDQRVRTLQVIEAVPQVIDWHHRHLLPLAPGLTADPRCQLVEADFFATIAAHAPFGPDAPDLVHAVIVANEARKEGHASKLAGLDETHADARWIIRVLGDVGHSRAFQADRC